MRRVWVVLLAGCGFQSPATIGAPGTDASSHDALVHDAGPTCWTISTTNPTFRVSACVASLGPPITVMSDVSIDTDTGLSDTPGLGCAVLFSGDPVCALVASTVMVGSDVTVSAHGAKPLALLGHAIDIEGTVDVASHTTGALQAHGASADGASCNASTTPATGNGGGAGGTYDSLGGSGGDSVASKGASAPTSNAIAALVGGCASVLGTSGAHSGGAVWIATDTGTLTIGSSAVINASGAGGAGGPATSSKRGGIGGGSGGMIVLQAPTITLMTGAKVFANGGGGGAGASSAVAGTAGTDPTDPMVGAPGGAGVNNNGAVSGSGGTGFAVGSSFLAGGAGTDSTTGGGGGGGGAGAIRVRSATVVQGAGVSPLPVPLLD